MRTVGSLKITKRKKIGIKNEERKPNRHWSCSGTGKLGGICEMKNRVAIIGAGMTLFRRRMLESPKELSFEATRMALDSAGLELRDIQSVVSGSAPDAFDGMHMKGEYLLDGMGGIGKPNQRVY